MSQQEIGVDKEAVKREFNFFITIQSALISGRFLFQSGAPNFELIYAGLILSAVWYVFGAQDRFLVDVYRTQAQEAGKLIHKRAQSSEPYSPIGEISAIAKTVRQKQKPWDRVTSWRWEPISITRLAALVPIVIFLLWLVLLIVQNSG